MTAPNPSDDLIIKEVYSQKTGEDFVKLYPDAEQWQFEEYKLREAISLTRAQVVGQVKEIIEKDIMFMSDARDILLDLKKQGVGTGNCEELFDKRVNELKEIIKSPFPPQSPQTKPLIEDETQNPLKTSLSQEKDKTADTNLKDTTQKETLHND